MEQEIRALLEKGAIEYIPHSNRETGFYSRYFIVPKKDGGLRPMLDLRVLNESVMQLKFKMLTLRQIVSQIRSEDWFVMIDLKDAYFQMSMSQEVPEVRFWGQSIPVSGSSIRPSIITLHFHEMRRCSPGTSSASGYSHYELYRRLVDFWRCLRDLVMWKKPWFLSQGPMLGASCRRKMLTTDDSLTGWGAISEGRSSKGLWKDHHLSWHINRLEMLAVFLALKNFLTDLRGHHVLVRSDNTSVVSYINHQGGLRSRPLCKLACQILLWSQRKLLSLRATYIPGVHNIGADILSRQGLRPGDWRLHPEVVELIWKEFGQAQVDLFASRETSHCPLWFSLTHPAPLGLDAMTQMWPRLHLYAFPPIALLPGVLERVRRDRVPLLLIAPRWPGRVWFPNLFSLLDGPPLELPVRRDLLSQAGARYFTLIHNYGNCGLGL